MDFDEQANVMAETENLLVWRSMDDDGYIYHLELGSFSLHLSTEEWEELVILIRSASTPK